MQEWSPGAGGGLPVWCREVRSGLAALLLGNRGGVRRHYCRPVDTTGVYTHHTFCHKIFRSGKYGGIQFVFTEYFPQYSWCKPPPAYTNVRSVLFCSGFLRARCHISPDCVRLPLLSVVCRPVARTDFIQICSMGKIRKAIRIFFGLL